VGKIMIAVATIFIARSIPNMVILAVKMSYPDFSIAGEFRNAYFVAGSFAILFNGLNSGIKVLVYYNMSSNFRQEFRSLMTRKDPTQ